MNRFLRQKKSVQLFQPFHQPHILVVSFCQNVGQKFPVHPILYHIHKRCRHQTILTGGIFDIVIRYSQHIVQICFQILQQIPAFHQLIQRIHCRVITKNMIIPAFHLFTLLSPWMSPTTVSHPQT